MKRKNFKIKLVDMCIYIDKHIYEPNFDANIIFEYLQNLFYALSIKKRLFNNDEDYERYSIYGATQAYLRLTNVRQFLSDDDPRKLPKVKSILNWVKRLLYPFKVDYQKLEFNDVYKDEFDESGVTESIKNEMSESIKDSNSGILKLDIESYFKSIHKIIKSILKETPYTKDKVMMHKLYISCLLTLLRGFTLSNEDIDKLEHFRKNAKNITDDYLSKLYYKSTAEAPIAWHLEEGMEDYIHVLTTRMRKMIVKDINYLIKADSTSEDIIETILMSPLSELNENEFEVM